MGAQREHAGPPIRLECIPNQKLRTRCRTDRSGDHEYLTAVITLKDYDAIWISLCFVKCPVGDVWLTFGVGNESPHRILARLRALAVRAD